MIDSPSSLPQSCPSINSNLAHPSLSLSLKNMAITMKGCYTVKPAEETPNINLSVTECDQIHPITHAPNIYFYRPPTPDFSFASAIETLKTSLSKVLVHFYPVAGRLHSIDGGRLEIECNSMGVQFYEAESDAEVADYGDFSPTSELRRLTPSVNYDVPIHELPLLLVQLTKFRCGGMSLGLGFSHTVADGGGALHFLAEWARIARGELLGLAPFLDRLTAWKKVDNDLQTTPLQFDHIEFSPFPLLIGQSDDKEERKKETSVVMLRLTKTHIEKLKNQANNQGNNNNGSRPYSRFEFVTGHIWKCTSKARQHENDQLSNLRIVVNCRNRLSPPLPKGYFGNAIFPTMATSRVGDLVSESLGYASSKIREAIEKLTDDYIRASIDFLKTQSDLSKFRGFHTVGCAKGPFFGNPNLDVTSWVSMPLYGADFGWGKEIYMGPGGIGYDGKCFIISSPDDGDESLSIALRLQVRHLDSFNKFFYEDIDHENVG